MNKSSDDGPGRSRDLCPPGIYPLFTPFAYNVWDSQRIDGCDGLFPIKLTLSTSTCQTILIKSTMPTMTVTKKRHKIYGGWWRFVML